METEYNYNDYFQNRNVDATYYEKYKLPRYLKEILPVDRQANILDIGCGFGQLLAELTKGGYTACEGIDLSEKAVSYCISQQLKVQQINSLQEFIPRANKKYDFIVMSHVLEHIDKSQVIELLRLIRLNLLSDSGQFCVMVPNAQSNTGSYWMYEDFTHYTLYTAGSLYYVLKSAGFKNVTFVDPMGTANIKRYKRWIIHLLLWGYKKNQDFWNIVTGSSFHKASPRIYTFELKALAS